MKHLSPRGQVRLLEEQTWNHREPHLEEKFDLVFYNGPGSMF